MRRKWQRSWKRDGSRNELHKLIVNSLLAITTAVTINNGVYAAPAGGQIASGSGSITQQGTVTSINQASDKLAVNWQSFNIAANEKVQFIQPSTSAIALNRILGNNPSQIYGQLSANGKVFLTNPNGILFGAGAQVNVGGLVAASQQITDADFLAGRYIFSGESGQVINQGNIQAAERGYVALLAPAVRNEGIIAARLGSVAIGSGKQATLDFAGDGKINLAIDEAAVKANIENRRMIQADGGTVIMSAKAKDAIVDTVINNSGIIQARSISNENGIITISGGSSGIVEVSGTLDASGRNAGETGGSIKVLGDRVGIFDGAKLDAAGDHGGGAVLVGGNYQGKGTEQNAARTFMAPNAEINADAIVSGNGGKVVVWADGDTQYYGNISAKGGRESGDGGLAEVSGKNGLAFNGQVNLKAENGKAGLLLLDPKNIIIGYLGTDSINHDILIGDAPQDGDLQISVSAVNAAIGTGNVRLQAANDITINSEIFNVDSVNKLSLDAGRNVVVSDRIYLPQGTVSLQGNMDPYGGIYRDGGTGNIIFDEYSGITAANVLMRLESTTVPYTWKAGEILIRGGQFRTNTLNVYTDGAFTQYLTQFPDESFDISGRDNTYCNDVLIQARGNVSIGLIKSLSTLIVTKGNFSVLYNNMSGIGGHYPGIMTGDTGKFWVYATNPYASDLKHMASQPNVAKLYGRPEVMLNDMGVPNLNGLRPDISGKNGYFLFTGIPTLNLVADNLSKTYGDPNPALTYHVTGLVAGDNLQDVLVGAPILSLSGGGKNSGSHPIYIGYGNASAYNGYTLGLQNGILTVNKAPLYLTAGSGAITFGDSLPNLSTAISGQKYNEQESDIFSSIATVLEDYHGYAGQYLTTANYQLKSNNYYINPAINKGTLTVNKAPLNVAVQNTSRLYGDVNPVFTVNFGNLKTVNNQIIMPEGSVNFTTGADLSSNIGNYSINAAGLTSNNYDISYSAGNLTVNPRPITVAADNRTRIYGDENPTTSSAIVVAGSLVNGDVIDGVSVTTDAVAASRPAEYNLTPQSVSFSAGAAANYRFTYLDGKLTVLKAPLIVKANDETRLYGQPNPLFTASFGGFKLGENESVLGGRIGFDTQAGPDSPIADYEVTPYGLASDSYDIRYNSGILKVLSKTDTAKDIYHGAISAAQTVSFLKSDLSPLGRADRTLVITTGYSQYDDKQPPHAPSVTIALEDRSDENSEAMPSDGQ